MRHDALALDAKHLYRDAAPAVVHIAGTGGASSILGIGTGSIVNSDGYILTNSHVIMHEGAIVDHIVVSLKPDSSEAYAGRSLGKSYEATMIARSVLYDLAILKIDTPFSLPTLKLSDLANVDIGEDVIAIGHPGSGADWTMTAGRISGSFEDFEEVDGYDLFQTDTSLNPGNSGGPLLDASGQIVGVNSFVVRQGRDGFALDGLNFAVKSTTALAWVKKTMGEDFLPAETKPVLPLPEPPSVAAPEIGPEAPSKPSANDSQFAGFLDALRNSHGAEATEPKMDQPENGGKSPAKPESSIDHPNDGLANFLRELDY